MALTSKFYGNNLFGKSKPINRKKKKNKGYGKFKSGPVLSYKSDEFYQSRAWLELRYKALVKYGAKCQCCGRSRHDNVQIHVDHIKPRVKHPELELNLANLQVLCNECNIGKSYTDSTDWR